MQPKPEKETVQMRAIAVGLYGQTSDQSLEGKISQIKTFLTKHGGNCEIKRTTVDKKGADILIEFEANVPAWFVNQHHAFDSVLNSTTNGFGLAWVEER